MRNRTKFIVMYTIKEKRKDMREKFLNLLMEEFDLNDVDDKLNESTYAIGGDTIEVVRNRLQKMIKDNDINLKDGEDFVDLYYSGELSDDAPEKKYLYRTRISPIGHKKFVPAN